MARPAPTRLPRALVAIAPVIVLVLAAPGPFEGCDGASRMESRPLPRDTSGACFDDGDCVPVGCEALRCVAGACQRRSDIRDADGDGHAPPPCGMDCDDDDVRITPGASETCDLVDEDCDGTIDEDAAPRAIRFDLSTIDPTMAAVAWGEDLLVTDAVFSPTGVRVRRIALGAGTLGTSAPLLEIPGESVRFARGADAGADGAAFAFAVEDDETLAQSIVLVRVRRLADGSAEMIDQERRAATDVGALDVAVVAGTVVIGWDEGATRFLWSPAWPDAIQVGEGLVEGLGPLDLATDGAHAIVPVGLRTLAFHLPADGALVGTQTMTGDLSIGAPVADGDGGVVAIVRDAVDYSVQSASLATVGERTTLPSGGGLGLSLDAVTRGLLLTRVDSVGVRAWVLATDPRDNQTFGPSEISGPTRAIAGVDVLPTGGGTAILTNFGDAGSSLAVLACDSTGP